MSESDEFVFNNDYCGRVKRFREEMGMTAAEMATLLDIPPDRYRKYEFRSPMPAYLIPKFCLIIGCDLEHLLMGKPRERIKPVLIARKASSDSDIARRIEALPPEKQATARAAAETIAAMLHTNRRKGTRGS